jgi:hypothetical protein
MMRRYYFPYIIVFLLLHCLFFPETKAQKTIKGIVIDSISGKPLSYISVYLKGTTVGTLTNDAGEFSLKNPSSAQILIASSMGYKKKYVLLENKGRYYLNILLSPSSYAMSEVIIKPNKEKYRKKGNPAVDLVRKIIDSKERYDPFEKAYYHYEHYQKVTIALNDFDRNKKSILVRKFGFLTSYVDTSTITGKPILPVSVRESVDEFYYQKSPREEKTVVKADESTGIENHILSEDGVNTFLNEVFKPVNIYDNDIQLLIKRFVSPLSTGAIGFYKFFLMDSVMVGGERCADLVFVPFSSESTGFVGHLYVTLDTTYFVKKVQLSIPKNINLNFIKSLSIEQDFTRSPDGTRLLILDDMTVEFSILSISGDFYARRTNIYMHHSFDAPVDQHLFIEKKNTIVKEDTAFHLGNYRKRNRLDTLGVREESISTMLKKLRNDPLYDYSEKILAALVTGYVATAPQKNKVDIGPIYTMISDNTIEGLRLRAGGTTTAYLNDHWFGKGYLAYGAKDQQLKYLAQVEYAINKKEQQANEFPIHSIRASYQYDVNWLGEHNIFADNLFLSLKRQIDDKITYMRTMELSYNQEYYSHFSYGVDLRYRREYATVFLPFIDNSTNRNIDYYSLGEAEFRLRYAPGEKFYQTLGARYSISHDAPVFSLSHTVALKGTLGSNYDYSYSEVGFQKRFWFAAYGDADVVVKAGKVWTKDPFPLLIIPNANLSYTIQPESYPMMNALEFINDQYISWDLNYNMNGMILNRIPLLRYLKWREILSFRGIYGSLDKKNDPAYSDGLFEFPTGAYKMGKTPYMEAGVGVDNIFNVLRVDYVWRLNYLNHPHIDKSGIRIKLDFSF